MRAGRENNPQLKIAANTRQDEDPRSARSRRGSGAGLWLKMSDVVPACEEWSG